MHDLLFCGKLLLTENFQFEAFGWQVTTESLGSQDLKMYVKDFFVHTINARGWVILEKLDLRI